MVSGTTSLELGETYQTGLKLLNSLPKTAFETLVKGSIRALLSDEVIDFGALGVEGKRAHAGLLAAILEASKLDLNAKDFETFLLESQVADAQAAYISAQYDSSKPSIRDHLSRITFGFPRLHAAQWKLDYCVRTSSLDKVQEPVFHVRLVADAPICCEGKNNSTSTGNTLQFICSMPEMTELVNALRDACKQVDRVLANSR
eukprot:TRINITY_DN5654_c0_g1::TRINITY_DN5654_c0_g1_i1::g.12039::m.12039 TRINITY_DN5654_c0_g1::TRINITY_DN5654_c0_g1_i1::g.12039  ORF type:complete len:220 (+),score=10.72,sp/Q54QK4/COMD3_DICDI/26.43/2e-15,HCaRG/PF07258.9/2e-22 TRINITY_DN5654_c0_g1_i1:55-660(+)